MIAASAREPGPFIDTRCAAARPLEVSFATTTGSMACRRSRGRAAVTAQAVAIAVIIATASTFQKAACAVRPRGAASSVANRNVSCGATANAIAPSA